MSKTVIRYGYQWPDVTDLEIEMGIIQRWPQVVTGHSLSFHYEQMRKILWPTMDAHRWHDLIRDEIRRPGAKVTVLMGPGSTSKTNGASWNYLCEYLCFPEDTCVLVSSTDIRGLRKRVWGEVAMLWQQAIEAYDWLPGNMLDAAIAIATDSLEDLDIGQRKTRDMRKGIFGVPCMNSQNTFVGLTKYHGIKQKRMRLVADEACFPAGTMVDTPSGKRPIESLRKGDLVYSALGARPIRHAMKTVSRSLVKVNLSDGRSIICTDNHPFLTNKGWEKACHLTYGQYMISTYEAMSIMRKTVQTVLQPTMVRCLSICNPEVQTLPERIPSHISSRESKFLQQVLRVEMEHQPTGVQSKPLLRGTQSENRQLQSRVVAESPGSKRGSIEAIEGDVPQPGVCIENDCHSEKNRTPSQNQGRERDRSNRTGETITCLVPGGKEQLPCSHASETRKWIPNTLQNRRGIPEDQTGGRSGRKFTFHEDTPRTGHSENCFSHSTWVDSVEVLEPRSSGLPGVSGNTIAVYNLEVEGHPSFSVEGLLVHNSMMGSSFLQSFANLNQNEDFQAIVIGNPNDPMDPLGRAAEPKDGWTAHMQPEKTCVWDTRFMNGRCVNLIGTDSPNFDFPENQPTRYKYLISRQKIAEVVSAFGKDSFEYHSQCVGDMQIGQMSRRVITRDLCRQFGAQNDVVWLGTGLTKVAALDAAYGGDRCVLGHIEFGKEASGKVVINIYPPVIVPIVSKSDMVPEDQIAEFCKDYCERHGITPENFFHDSTGRGTLGTHLARIWSAQCNPIEFGGAPTKRPVSMDIYTRDAQTGQRRLKRCDEHYRKFVTELWYSVRYAIEAGQIRNLPEDVMDEGCMRMWDKTKDDKIELETKQEMKERVGRSPDLFDFIAIAVEGARRRGFQISKLANEESESRNLDWLFHVEQEERKRRKEFELAEV